jgi:hypothetical protein
MSSPIGTLADAIVAYVDAHKSDILAAAAAENANVAALVENAALNFIQTKQPALYPFLQGTIKGAGPQLVTFLGGEEAALFAITDAALHAEAVKLGG